MTDWARIRFASARSARLGTVTPDGTPHLVPVVFAMDADLGGDPDADLGSDPDADRDGDMVWTAVDEKPKTTRALRRLSNVRAHPSVSLLVDHYEEDWSALWWVRVDGVATVLGGGSEDEARAVAALVAKYPQYVAKPPQGPVLAIAVTTWRAWAASAWDVP